MKAHWDVLASVDFTTVEVWTKSGLVTFYLLFVMDVATRLRPEMSDLFGLHVMVEKPACWPWRLEWH